MSITCLIFLTSRYKTQLKRRHSSVWTVTRPQYRTVMECDTFDAWSIPPNATESPYGAGQVTESALDVHKSRDFRSYVV